MKKEKNLIGYVALVVSLIAIVAVLGNIYATGNTIKVNQNTSGIYDIYTKAEIDARFVLNGIVQLVSTANSSTVGIANDKATFKDITSGEIIGTVWTQEGKGKIVVNGRGYTVTMRGDSNNASEGRTVTITSLNGAIGKGLVGNLFLLS